MEVISQGRGGGDGSGRVGIEVVLLATVVGVSTLYNILSASPCISLSWAVKSIVLCYGTKKLYKDERERKTSWQLWAKPYPSSFINCKYCFFSWFLFHFFSILINKLFSKKMYWKAIARKYHTNCWGQQWGQS